MFQKGLSCFFYSVGIGFTVLLLCNQVVSAKSLTLKRVEYVALSQSPELKSLQHKSDALAQLAIAQNQLPDPKLMAGTMNVPVDTFNFSQEPMTQIQVGLQQSFPKGRSLHYRSMQSSDLSISALHQKDELRLLVLKKVRLSWLNLYYWVHARNIISKQKRVFRHLVKVTESMLINNRAQQKDVVRAQLELTELDNRLLEVNQHIKTTRASLARWIGQSLANQANPQSLPRWSSPPALKQLYHLIKHHPQLEADEAAIAAGHANIKYAEQQFIPGFTVGVAYGLRQGRNLNGQRRADFLTAQISMDLPIFTQNRQSRRLQASEDQLLSSEENQNSHFRQLSEDLGIQYATWRQQRKSAWLYQRKLIPEARQYAQATQVSYENTQTDFPTLARAYVRELNTELAGLKARVSQKIARVNLLYLQGQ